jgi:hypothetical protein
MISESYRIEAERPFGPVRRHFSVSRPIAETVLAFLDDMARALGTARTSLAYTNHEAEIKIEDRNRAFHHHFNIHFDTNRITHVSVLFPQNDGRGTSHIGYFIQSAANIGYHHHDFYTNGLGGYVWLRLGAVPAKGQVNLVHLRMDLAKRHSELRHLLSPEQQRIADQAVLLEEPKDAWILADLKIPSVDLISVRRLCLSFRNAISAKLGMDLSGVAFGNDPKPVPVDYGYLLWKDLIYHCVLDAQDPEQMERMTNYVGSRLLAHSGDSPAFLAR